MDVVYDMTGGRHTAASLAALAPLGELMFGALGRFGLSPAETEGMFAKNQSLTGFALLPLVPPASLERDLGYLFQRAAVGALEVPEGRCYPLGKAAEAHKALESRQTMGKVVLKPGKEAPDAGDPRRYPQLPPGRDGPGFHAADPVRVTEPHPDASAPPANVLVRPLTAETGVRFPLGVPIKSKT